MRRLKIFGGDDMDKTRTVGTRRRCTCLDPGLKTLKTTTNGKKNLEKTLKNGKNLENLEKTLEKTLKNENFKQKCRNYL